MVDGKLINVVDVKTAKTGKHGSAKVFVTTIDPTTGQKKEILVPSGS